jgi:outer membrane lipoprotein-sorting protein
LVVVLALSLLPRSGPVRAEPAAPAAWDLARLLRGFSAVKEAKARYVERKFLRVLKQPIQDSGILVYAAPDYLRKEMLEPHHELMVVTGDKLTVERNGETQTLNRNDYPHVWAFIEGIRATLAGDLSALQAVYSVTLEGDETKWQMSLQPLDPQMQEIVSSIRIFGAAAQITRVDTRERDGDRTDMFITKESP